MLEKPIELINEVNEISKKYKTMAMNTGANFNIFNILNIGQREVYLCCLLKELIDPKGSHFQGNTYLNLFFDVLRKNHNDKFNLKNMIEPIVSKEEVIEKLRRIDITIDDFKSKQYLPIEVKIYAQDQKEQCKDYLKKAFKKYSQNNNARLCYLTINGNMPDEISTDKLTLAEKEQIIPISWKKDIIEWVDNCISNKNTINKPPIREVLIQFKKTIQEFCGEFKDTEQMEIENLLIDNLENFENAKKISEAIKIVQDSIWNNFCDGIKLKIKKYIQNIEPTSNGWYVCYEIGNKKIYIDSNHQKNLFGCFVEEKNNITNFNKIKIEDLIGKDNFEKVVTDCSEWIIKKINDEQ